MAQKRDTLVDAVVRQYLTSGDFNGYAIADVPRGRQRQIVRLIGDRKLDLVRGDRHPNPHIKAFDCEPAEEQIAKIARNGLTGCLYPTPELLGALDARENEQAPFTRELKIGEAQLAHRAFDLRVLEWYRNDPRFYYYCDDIHGQLHQRGEQPVGGVIKDDLEFLEFGFAYNKKMERAIAVFLRDLHALPADQQQYLAGFLLDGEYQLHPDFARTQLIGDFPERVSVYDAFLEEKYHVNQMCERMGKPHLFRSGSRAYDRPAGFGILIRPTKKEFRDFALLLDQLLSDDLNRKFFEGDIPTTEKLRRSDGTEVKQPIGTIALLETWTRKHFRPRDPSGIDELFSDLRTVRKARQEPAHKSEDNEFDQQYIERQRALIKSAFSAVRMIRMIFENHPKVMGYEVDDWLREAKVWML